MTKRILIYTTIIVSIAFLIVGCGMLTSRKQYALDVKCTCPDGESVDQKIPEILMVHKKYATM